jgi:hypothetical protein
MKKQASNKFNKTRTATGATPPLGYFPIKQFRFKTEKHPVITGTDRCSSSVEAKWSQQELLMIAGLTNILQCKEREAIRIAIFEGLNGGSEQLLAHIDAAKAGSTHKGHEGRTTSKRIRMTKKEKENFSLACKSHGIRDTELIRLVVIRLAKGIRDGSIARLTNSALISQMELFREWSSSHKVTESKLKALKSAAAKAWNEANDLANEQWEHNQDQKQQRRIYRSTHPGIEDETLDALILIEHEDHLEKIIQRYVQEQKLNKSEEKVFRWMFQFDLTEEEAIQIVEDQEKEESDRLADEEWETINAEIKMMFEEMDRLEIEDHLEATYGEALGSMTDEQVEEAKQLFLEKKTAARAEQQHEMNQRLRNRFHARIRREDPEHRDNIFIQAIFDKNIQID